MDICERLGLNLNTEAICRGSGVSNLFPLFLLNSVLIPDLIEWIEQVLVLLRRLNLIDL